MRKFNGYQQKDRFNKLRVFQEELLPFIAFEYDVSEPSPSCYKVKDTPKGNITIYPKSRKIQLSNGSWINGNIHKWLKNNIIKEKI